jgi:ribonuclease-3
MKSKTIEAPVEKDLAGLLGTLGHVFKQPELLVRALTHRSLANEKGQVSSEDGVSEAGHNERLEFLGDAVIGLVVAEALFQLHPEWREGELTVLRAQLVSRQHMAKVAAAIDLGSYLRLSRGEDRGSLRRTDTVLSNTMEAVMGALFLDGGLEPVKTFAWRYVMGETAERLAKELRSGAALGNYKSALQEYLQSRHAGTPVYKVKGETGPDHRKRFLVEVRLETNEGEHSGPMACGMGLTKKHAEQDSARRALSRLMAAEARSSGPADERQAQEEEPGSR